MVMNINQAQVMIIKSYPISPMINIEKVNYLIKKSNWQGITSYLDEVIAGQQQDQNMQKHWLTDYHSEKMHIITTLHQLYQQTRANNSSDQPQHQLSSLEQCIVKLFAKGLTIPQLSSHQDINLLTQIITSSKNSKYLFILYQENLCQIKILYNSFTTDFLDKIMLKLLFIVTAFIKNLLALVIFDQVVNHVHEFYAEGYRVMGQENVIEQSDKQLKEFIEKFTNNTLESINGLFQGDNELTSIGILRDKPKQRSHLFRLIKLLHIRSNESTDTICKIKTLLNKLISKLNITLINLPQIPSLWISQHLEHITTIYSPNQTLHYFGTILIKQLPNKPQYSQISTHLFPLINHICSLIYSNPQPIRSLSLKDNPQFFILLFQRFSLLMGLTNRQKQDESHVNLMLNAILNKKHLFSSPVLSQTLWSILMQRHDDINFKMFCINQYKKLFTLTIKQLQQSSLHLITQGHKTILKLITQLQPNSNPEFIGFHITLTIYFISCINKMTKFYSGQTMKSTKTQMVFNYFFSDQKVKCIKQKLKETLMNLKQGLKDRLQVYKMKNQQNHINEKQQKQANEVAICIYRIQQEINFN